MEEAWVEVARKYDSIWHPSAKFDLAGATKILATGDKKLIFSKLGIYGVMDNLLGLKYEVYLEGCLRLGESAKLLRGLGSRLLSKFIANYVAEIQKGEEFANVTCKKACSACCHQEIAVYVFEAAEIVNYLRDHPDAVDREQLAKHAAWSKRSSEDGNYGWGRTKDLNEVRCPMLSKDGLCNIYDVRPMVCRNYVVKSHPRACDIRNDEKPLFMMHPDIARLMIILMQFDSTSPMAHAMRSFNAALKKPHATHTIV